MNCEANQKSLNKTQEESMQLKINSKGSMTPYVHQGWYVR